MKITYKRHAESDYMIHHGDTKVGSVAKGWTRSGGNGWYVTGFEWTNKKAGDRVSGRRFSTLADAKAAVERELAR